MKIQSLLRILMRYEIGLNMFLDGEEQKSFFYIPFLL